LLRTVVGLVGRAGEQPLRAPTGATSRVAAQWAAAPGALRLTVGAAATAVGGVAAWAATVVLTHRPVPVGVVVQGGVQGSLVALTAMGLVLVYRAARIVNFAQAAMGGITASLVEVAVLGWHVEVWLALAMGVLAASAVGALVHATVVRRLASSSRLVLTVATIGLLQVLSVANGFVPDLAGHLGPVTAFSLPVDGPASVGGVPFGGQETAVVVAVPLVLGGLWWFLQRSAIGAAVRACADSPERAGLLGIPVRRVGAVVWALAAALSGVGAVLTGVVEHTPVGVPLGPEDLFPALAAFVLAGFDSLPAAVGWSIVIGIVDDAVFWVYQNGTLAEVAVFVLVVVGLALRRHGPARGAPSVGELVAARRPTPLPEAVADAPMVRWVRRVAVVVAVAAAAAVPLALGPAQLDLVTAVPVYAIMALSLVVLAGWAGQISLGQFAFGGVGAIVTGVLLVHGGADLLLSLLASTVVCAAVAVAVGSVTRHLPGLTLAAVTMAFAVAVSDWLLSSASFPFLNPSSVPRPVLFDRFPMGPASPLPFYELCLVFMLLALMAVRNLRRSHAGRAIVASRDNRRAAASLGVDPGRWVLVALAVAGGLAGLAGGLYLVELGGLGSGGLTPSDSITVFIVAVVGGLTSPLGAVAGAVVFECVAHLVAPGLQQLATGAGVLVFLLFLPEGLGGLAVRARDRLLLTLAGSTTTPAPPAPASSAPLAGAGRGPGVLDEALGAAGLGAVPARSLVLLPEASQPDGHRRDGLVVRGVAVALGSVPVVRHLDLEVRPGQVVALLGTNGAGKSTALRAIAGALPVRCGSVVVDGVDVSSLAAYERARRGLVLVPGGRGVFPSLTVADNLRLAQRVWRQWHRTSAGAGEPDRVEGLFPRLAERHDVAAGQLSGGEQQMLALAMAMTGRPTVLMIDELSLGLAPAVVDALLRSVRSLADAGAAVVVVEQSLAVASQIADQVVFLERGEVRFRGGPTELASRHDLVRSVFLGAGEDAAHHGAPAGPAGLAPAVSVPAAAVPVAAMPAPAAGGPAGSHRGPPGLAPALEVDGLRRRYGGLTAVDGVSFTAAAGEIVGLVGANGAGKTTVLDLVSGFLPADAGRVRLGGRDVTALSPARRACAGLRRVSQEGTLFPSLTVGESVAAALGQRAAVRDPFLAMCWTAAARWSEEAVGEEARRLLGAMGLRRTWHQLTADLSTGTRRLVEVACATALQPRVLLLDEPTAGLARPEGEALIERLLALRDESGAAFVVVEHDIDLLGRLADHVICLHLGRVVAAGSPRVVLGDPAVLAGTGSPAVPAEQVSVASVSSR